MSCIPKGDVSTTREHTSCMNQSWHSKMWWKL